MTEGIKGKRILVPAGGGGIGRAIAIAFCRQGGRVTACDIDREALDSLAQEVPEIVTAEADVAEADHVERLFDAIRDTWPSTSTAASCACARPCP
jgi:NAD(P)-dependent dehydrogenase (short-subunit alcohol dehydrogenase family)